jgi:hypothetical protein
MEISENMENEKFDIETFNKNNVRGSYGFTTKEGTEILQMTGLKSGYVEWQSHSNKFYRICKVFYSNSKIKSKEYRFYDLKIGISEYYDEYGNKTLVNEDEKFGKFDYNHLILLLEKKGYINSKTAEGKENIDVSFFPKKKVWEIEVQRENEPLRKLIIDANTGYIIKVENVMRYE